MYVEELHVTPFFWKLLRIFCSASAAPSKRVDVVARPQAGTHCVVKLGRLTSIQPRSCSTHRTLPCRAGLNAAVCATIISNAELDQLHN